jgi:hypothetical protein
LLLSRQNFLTVFQGIFIREKKSVDGLERSPAKHLKRETKELKYSKTWQNLLTAFAGKSQAHTKYLYYASKAEKEGYVQIGALFRETALCAILPNIWKK